jgi:hypothetical protein
MPTAPIQPPPLEAQSFIPKQSSSDSDLNLNPSLDIDDDLFDELSGSNDVNHSLVEPHLVRVPHL